MESITIACGFSDEASDRMRSTPVSVRTRTRSVASPSRVARRPICSADSSPLTYSTGSRRDSADRAWISRVDLPTPGSPPISTTEPATSPPPSTRSSSDSPVGVRSAVAVSTSERSCTPGPVSPV